MFARILLASLFLLLVSSALSFSPERSHVHVSIISDSKRIVKIGMVGGRGMPYGPPGGSQYDANTNESADSSAADQGDTEGGTLKGNRFSKYAPDASLSTPEFRDQLKENMKADLERRRREDPNRGNQPAKTYLDNL